MFDVQCMFAVSATVIHLSRQGVSYSCLPPSPSISPGSSSPSHLTPSSLDTGHHGLLKAQRQNWSSSLCSGRVGACVCHVIGARSCPVLGKRKHKSAPPQICPFLRGCSEQQSAASLATVFLISLIMFEIALLFTETEEKAFL